MVCIYFPRYFGIIDIPSVLILWSIAVSLIVCLIFVLKANDDPTDMPRLHRIHEPTATCKSVESGETGPNLGAFGVPTSHS